jgi:hypothetical protein
MRRRSNRITGIIKEEARLVPGDGPLKAIHLLFHQCRKELRIRHFFGLQSIDRICDAQERWIVLEATKIASK